MTNEIPRRLAYVNGTLQDLDHATISILDRGNLFGDGVYEVVLGVTLTCTVEDKTIYLVEVAQAGIFGLAGFDDATLDAMLGIHCPNILFPYARQTISDLISSGGFPPFYLQPMNFEAIYAEGLRRRAEQVAGASEGSTVMTEGGNA